MLYVVQAMSKEIGDVAVQTIENLSPLFACFYESHLAQGAHMV